MTRKELLERLSSCGYTYSEESQSERSPISLLWPISISGEVKKARLYSTNMFRSKSGKFLPFSVITPQGDYVEAATVLRNLELELDPE